MVLYGVENHYMITGDSDVTHLFRTEAEAMAYLMGKFDENADEDGCVVESIGWNQRDYVTRAEAMKNKGFYHDTVDGNDHYRIVKYEIEV